MTYMFKKKYDSLFLERNKWQNHYLFNFKTYVVYMFKKHTPLIWK
jgi:hypothetical protein